MQALMAPAPVVRDEDDDWLVTAAMEIEDQRSQDVHIKQEPSDSDSNPLQRLDDDDDMSSPPLVDPPVCPRTVPTISRQPTSLPSTFAETPPYAIAPSTVSTNASTSTIATPSTAIPPSSATTVHISPQSAAASVSPVAITPVSRTAVMPGTPESERLSRIQKRNALQEEWTRKRQAVENHTTLSESTTVGMIATQQEQSSLSHSSQQVLMTTPQRLKAMQKRFEWQLTHCSQNSS